MREFFRLNKDSFPDRTDILISVKSSEFINKLSDVEDELRVLLKKAVGAGSL